MLEELVTRSGAAAWAIGSMFFFLAAFVAVVVWVMLRPRDEMAARARLPLEGEEQGTKGTGNGSGTRDNRELRTENREQRTENR